MSSLGERLGTTQTQDYVLLGALAVAAYVLYNLVQGVKTTANLVGTGAAAVANALTTTGNALGSGLYTLFGPSDIGTNLYYTVAFPDGSHAVPSNIVNADGTFNWAGYPAGSQAAVTYQLVKDSSGHWYATVDTPDFGLANPGSWS